MCGAGLPPRLYVGGVYPLELTRYAVLNDQTELLIVLSDIESCLSIF